jgi:Peptidase MA superfamily
MALSLSAAPCEPQVRVRGHALEGHADSRPLVVELSERAPALWVRAAEAVGLESCPAVDVELVSAIEGAALLDPPWHLPPWAAGAAVPGARRVVVAVTANGQRQQRERVLLHELAHVAVTARTGEGQRVPRWLDEGIARVVANEDGSADLLALAKARVGDRLFPLSALEASFPSRADLAQLAYAQSARAVAAIRERGGPEAIPRLLGLLHGGASLDEALLGVTGRQLWQLDLDVERSIPTWRALAIVGLETDLAFAASSLVVAWAGFRARRRIRERLGALAEEELDEERAARRRAPPLGVVLARFRVPRSLAPS